MPHSEPRRGEGRLQEAREEELLHSGGAGSSAQTAPHLVLGPPGSKWTGEGVTSQGGLYHSRGVRPFQAWQIVKSIRYRDLLVKAAGDVTSRCNRGAQRSPEQVQDLSPDS